MATQASASAVRESWIPRTHAPLVARDDELARIVRLLQRQDTSLLTLVGPPGAGKTTLALLTANAVGPSFRDGVSFVDLTATRDPALVAQTVAGALGIADASGEDLVETLIRVLRDRRVLLILDNFEQVLAAAAVVQTLLDQCAHLKILVTSRAALELSFEQQCLVPPLALPDLRSSGALGEIDDSAAVTLFKLRAQAVNPSWELSRTEATVVAELCVRLDGLPLAIELAASWMGILSPAAMLDQLNHTLDLLVSTQADRHERHRTLRAAIRWSEDLLDPALQLTFRRLAVFAGGWTLQSALSVCDDLASQPAQLLDRLRRLASHHLITVTNHEDGHARFGMLVTINDYALERLAESGELQAVRQLHAAYFLRLVKSAEIDYHGPNQAVWLDRLEREYENLRAVLDWCADSVDQEVVELGVDLAAGLWFFWTVRGHIREGRERLHSLLSRPAASAKTLIRAKALTAAGWLAWFNSDAEAAFGPLDEALAIYKCLEDQPGTARVMAITGLCLAVYTNELNRAREVLDQAWALSQAIAEPWAMGFSTYGLGHLAAREGANDQALASFEHSLALRTAAGNRWGVGYSLYRLSLLALARNDLQRAAELQYQSLSTSWELRNKRGMAVSAEVLACLAGIQGRGQRSARLFGVARALLDAANYVLPPTLFDLHKRAESAARAEIGNRAFTIACNQGRNMPLADGIALALAEHGLTSGQGNPDFRLGSYSGLSRRETDVVRLVSLGLTDRQIAAQLAISPRTVDGHLRRVFGKIGVGSRAALTAWVVRNKVGFASEDSSQSLVRPVQSELWQREDPPRVVANTSA